MHDLVEALVVLPVNHPGNTSALPPSAQGDRHTAPHSMCTTRIALDDAHRMNYCRFYG